MSVLGYPTMFMKKNDLSCLSRDVDENKGTYLEPQSEYERPGLGQIIADWSAVSSVSPAGGRLVRLRPLHLGEIWRRLSFGRTAYGPITNTGIRL